MDIVYILGTGSKFNDEEIKYSLRSLKNLKHGNVFVIGEKPEFFSDEIKHVQADDPYNVKQKNAFHKLMIACNTKAISKDFILMNDDFFILKELEDVKYSHRGDLKARVDKIINVGSPYVQAMERTYNLLGGGFDYSMHYPFIYNKSKLKKVLKKLGGDDAIHLRTFYGNTYKVGGEQRDDVKIRDKRSFNKFKDGDVISTDDYIFGSTRFQKLLHKLFPKKSKYEL